MRSGGNLRRVKPGRWRCRGLFPWRWVMCGTRTFRSTRTSGTVPMRSLQRDGLCCRYPRFIGCMTYSRFSGTPVLFGRRRCLQISLGQMRWLLMRCPLWGTRLRALSTCRTKGIRSRCGLMVIARSLRGAAARHCARWRLLRLMRRCVSCRICSCGAAKSFVRI